MSTRSNIAIRESDGKMKVIYCHFDGYPLGGVGEQLLNHYKDETKVRKLIELGGISSLDDEIEDTKNNAYANRDDCEKEILEFKDDSEYAERMKDDIWIEYIYVYDVNSQEWLMMTPIGKIPPLYAKLEEYIQIEREGE